MKEVRFLLLDYGWMVGLGIEVVSVGKWVGYGEGFVCSFG